MKKLLFIILFPISTAWCCDQCIIDLKDLAYNCQELINYKDDTPMNIAYLHGRMDGYFHAAYVCQSQHTDYDIDYARKRMIDADMAQDSLNKY